MPEASPASLDDLVAGTLTGSALAARPTAAAVTRQGETVHWQSGRLVGSAVTAHSVFYAASVTKQLVACLAAMAVRDGVLDPQAPVVGYLPSLPRWTAPVRIQHLVHHTSGLPELTRPWAPALDNAEVLRRLRSWPGAQAAPGAAYEYSNTGYVLLAEVVQAVLGEPVERLAARRVFEPLGLLDGRLGGPAPLRLEDRPEPPRTVGDGGWWVSSSDLDRWLVALNSPPPAWEAAADLPALLEAPGRLDDGTELDYAWGVRVTERRGRRTITHGGGWPGWLAKTVRQPGQGIAVCLLTAAADEALLSETALALADRC